MASAEAQDGPIERLSGQGSQVFYDADLRGAAERVRDALPEICRDTSDRLGLVYDREPTFWVVRGRSRFNEVVVRHGGQAKPDFVAAVAFPYQDVVILDVEGWQRRPDDPFKSILQHEIVHLVLGDLERDHPGVVVPVWLHEGIAQWVSDRQYAGDADVLRRARSGGRLLSLESLVDAFPEQEGASELAYAQSLSLVRYISSCGAVHEDRRRNIAAILRMLRNGDSLDAALVTVTGHRGLEDVDRAWRNHVDGLSGVAVSEIPAFLWSGAILIMALLAWASFKVKRAQRMAAFDRLEADLPAAGPPSAEDDESAAPPKVDRVSD